MKIALYDYNNALAVLYAENNISIIDLLKQEGINIYKLLDKLDLDNLFFDAYEFDQEIGAKPNINKAKEIWLNRYRAARAPLLSALDVAFMRAVELGDTAKQAEIAAQKQALRDVTLTPLPEDLDGIKNTWPEILGPPL